VRNLSGTDLILSGPSGGGWLNVDIDIDNGKGNARKSLSQRPDAPNLKPISLKNGTTYKTTVNLGRFFPLAKTNNYGIKVSVYYPPLKKYIASGRVVANVYKPKNLWNQDFGVSDPRSEDRPLHFRNYALLSFKDRDTSNLYVRVASDDGFRVFRTVSLGNVLRSYDPNIDIDSSTRLHVLHLGAPQLYAHTIIDTDGSLVSQHYYKHISNSSKPKLSNKNGRFSVSGGIKTDRHGLAGTPQAAPVFNPGDTNRVRNATERPAGLPQR
jgi:hypothetical protein